MAISKTQEALITKLRAVGNSELAIEIDDEVCCYLVGVIVNDLGLRKAFPEIKDDLPPFFGKQPLDKLRLAGVSFNVLIERLLSHVQNADAYFYCLGTLHKARLKYERILKSQPVPTIDQVGPRALLQFGSLSPSALAGFLYWRKWVYDIDNRAAQETGYVFEPIIAHSIGGVPASASKSPVKRKDEPSKGRQVDCILSSERRAYEIKLRVTIAASGQGRWREELDFPVDCLHSGYKPVLLVFDPTANPKLTELIQAYKKGGGETHVGADAWNHLKEKAGKTMATFLERYVHTPIDTLLKEAPEKLPDLLLHMDEQKFTATIGKEKLETSRSPSQKLSDPPDELPEDVDQHIPSA